MRNDGLFGVDERRKRSIFIERIIVQTDIQKVVEIEVNIFARHVSSPKAPFLLKRNFYPTPPGIIAAECGRRGGWMAETD